MKTVKIAITGGIGSGKSTVSEIIKSKGFLVLSCDEIYRQLLMDERFVLSVCEKEIHGKKHNGIRILPGL